MSITEQHQYLSVTDSGRSSFDHEMASSSFLINNPLEDEPASAAESAVSTPVQMQLLSKLLNQSNKSGSNSNEAAEDVRFWIRFFLRIEHSGLTFYELEFVIFAESWQRSWRTSQSHHIQIASGMRRSGF